MMYAITSSFAYTASPAGHRVPVGVLQSSNQPLFIGQFTDGNAIQILDQHLLRAAPHLALRAHRRVAAGRIVALHAVDEAEIAFDALVDRAHGDHARGAT